MLLKTKGYKIMEDVLKTTQQTGMTMEALFKKFSVTPDEDELEFMVQESVIDNFLNTSSETQILNDLSKELKTPVEKILNFKHSLFDTFKRLGIDKKNMVGFIDEVNEGTVSGDTYGCSCVIGKVMTYQKGKEWQSQVRITGDLEPIEVFVRDIRRGHNPSNNLKMKALQVWSTEYLNTYF